ncbi:MAG: porin family protein [Hyphomicrobiaceae bacterium]|nr:porin family protein [Hyphomicrobiaceae bacterium]
MTSIRGTLAMGVMLVALTGTAATAADMYEGSVKDGYIPSPTVMSSPSSSWYLRVDGAYSSYDDPIMVEDHIYDLTDTSIDNSWSLGFGVGRQFGNGFRFDVTYDYRFEADASGSLQNHAAALDGTREFGLKSHLLLANVYYDFNQGGRFSPYLGVGLGWVRHETTDGRVTDTCGCTGTIEGDTTNSVAAAFMAGVTVNLTAGRGEGVSYGGSTKDAPIVVASNRGFLLDIGYRFLYLGDAATGPVTGDFGGSYVEVSEDPVVENIHAHEFRFGLRYNLN